MRRPFHGDRDWDRWHRWALERGLGEPDGGSDPERLRNQLWRRIVDLLYALELAPKDDAELEEWLDKQLLMLTLERS